MAKAILLVRVSTFVQDFEGQMTDLIRHAESKGYPVSDQIVIKNKESAIKLEDEEREGLTEMYQLLEEDKEREINAVFVWEVSRIGRKGRTLDNVKNYLIERRTQLYIYKPTLQLLNDDGSENGMTKVMFELLATMAQQEMLLKTERIMRQRRWNAENGRVSSGKPLFGYIKGENGKVEEDKKGGTADTVRNIFEMYENGESVLSIYDTLAKRGELEKIKKEDEQSTKKAKQNIIKRIISNPSYCGRTRENITIKSGKNEGKKCNGTTTQYKAIISEETFDNVARIRHERLKGEKKDTNNIYFGKGIIKYTEGHRTEAMCARRSTIDYYGSLTHTSISINLMDSILWNEAKQAKLEDMNKNSKAKKEELERNLMEITKKIETAYNIIARNKRNIKKAENAFFDEKMTKDDYYKKYDELKKGIEEEEREITKYEEKRAAKKRQLENAINGGENNTMADVETLGSNDNEKYNIIHEMIKKVIVRKNGENKIITLYNHDDDEFSNTYIYRKRGSKTTLFVMNDNANSEINLSEFVIKRFERKAYPKKER